MEPLVFVEGKWETTLQPPNHQSKGSQGDPAVRKLEVELLGFAFLVEQMYISTNGLHGPCFFMAGLGLETRHWRET